MTSPFEGRTCLVTGYGFVSYHLVDHLLRKGADVTVIEKNLLAATVPSPGVKLVYADLRYLHKEMTFDYVFHLAGIANAAYAEANPTETYEANVLATCNLLRHVKANERFLFTSSAVVYGNPTSTEPLTEEAPTQPISIYGATKIAAEELIKTFSRTQRLPYVIVRFFNLYGPRQANFYIVPQIAIQALRDRKISLRNDKVERDFLYVEDAIECLAGLATSELQNTIVNIGSGKSCSLGELVTKMLEALGNPNITVEAGSHYDPFSPIRLVADITRARKTCWEPTTRLGVGLSKTIDYYERMIKAQEVLEPPTLQAMNFNIVK